MTRRGWLRLMAAGVLVVWLCLFLHWDNTEKSMIRALLVETNGDSWTVGLLYQFPEASADSSEAEAAIRLCIGRGPELSSAVSAAEEALPQRADWRLCEYLLAGQDSVRQTLSACEELFLHRPYGRLASRVFGGSFSVEILKERTDESDALPENLLQCIKNAAPAAPRLYQQSSGFILPVVELEDEDTHCRLEALVVTPEQTGQLTESQTEMALLLQGKSWTDTGEHRFALEAGPLRLRRAFCGVEQEGESFLLRVNALSRNGLPADAEAELEALCADTVRRCWTLGLDISGLGAHQALRDGHFALTNKKRLPENSGRRETHEMLRSRFEDHGDGGTLVHNAVQLDAGVVDAVDALQEEQATEKVIFVHPKQVTQLRKDAEFTSTDKYPANVRMSGEIGSIAGCRVVPSKKVPLMEVGSGKTKCYACPIIKLEADHDNEDEVPALTIYRKRAVNVETERKPKMRTTEITADEFYVAVLSNEAKVVLAKFKA